MFTSQSLLVATLSFAALASAQSVPADAELKAYEASLAANPTYKAAIDALVTGIPTAQLHSMQSNPEAYINAAISAPSAPSWFAGLPAEYQALFESIGQAQLSIVQKHGGAAASGISDINNQIYAYQTITTTSCPSNIPTTPSNIAHPLLAKPAPSHIAAAPAVAAVSKIPEAAPSAIPSVEAATLAPVTDTAAVPAPSSTDVLAFTGSASSSRPTNFKTLVASVSIGTMCLLALF